MTLSSANEALVPVVIGLVAAFLTMVVGKWMDQRSDERRREEEGRRSSDHDIRAENAQYRTENDGLREDLLKCREERMLANLRCRQMHAVLMDAGIRLKEPFPELGDD